MSTPTLALPTTPLLTAEEFFAQYQNKRVELVRGIVKELPMPGAEHGYICSQFARFLANFAEEHGLGRVISNDSWIRVRKHPDTVRGPDVLLVSYSQLPKGSIPRGLLDIVPELLMEVRSPSDFWTNLIGKVLEYLQAGVKVVVVVNPEREAVAVYRNDAEEVHFGKDDELTLPDVLPGFSLPVKRLFE